MESPLGNYPCKRCALNGQGRIWDKLDTVCGIFEEKSHLPPSPLSQHFCTCAAFMTSLCVLVQGVNGRVPALWRQPPRIHFVPGHLNCTPPLIVKMCNVSSLFFFLFASSKAYTCSAIVHCTVGTQYTHGRIFTSVN